MKNLARLILFVSLSVFIAGAAGCQEMQGVLDQAKDLANDAASPSTSSGVQDSSGTPATTQPNPSTATGSGSTSTSGRAWERIDCSVTPLPDPPGFSSDVAGWTLMENPTPANVIDRGLSLVLGDPTSIFAIGDKGTLLRLDSAPARWTLIETPTTNALRGMADVGGWYSIIVGEGGTVLSYSQVDGIVREIDGPGGGEDFFAVWGDNSEDFHVLGDGVFYHYAKLKPSDPGYDPLDTSPKWQFLDMPVPPAPGDPTAPRVSDVWVYDYNSVFALVHEPTGGYYTIRWDGHEWRDKKTLPTTSLVRGIWGLAPDDIFAVGVGALVMHFDGSSWTEFNNTGLDQFNSYTDIWGTGHDNLFIVGDYDASTGALFHYDGQYWSGMSTPTPEGLNSILGTSASLSSVYVSGYQGALLHYSEGSAAAGPEINWLKLSLGDPSEANLNSVVSSGGTHYFVGQAGTQSLVLSYSDSGAYQANSYTNADIVDAVISNGKMYALSYRAFSGDQVSLEIGITIKDLNGSQVEYLRDSQEGVYLMAHSIAVDDDGSIYVGGQTSGPIGDQPHAGMFTEREGELNYDPYAWDAFIIKYSPQGDRQWVRVFGNPDSNRYPFGNLNGEKIIGMAFDSDGNLLVAGKTATPEPFSSQGDGADAISFPVENIGSFNGQNEIASSYGFIARFSPGGDFIDGRGWGTAGYDDFSGFELTDDGSIYLSGTTDFNGQIDGQQGNNSNNILVLKLDSELNRLWTRYLAYSGRQVVKGTTLAPDGGLYLAGGTSGTIGGRLVSDSGGVFTTQLSAEGLLLGTQVLDGTPWYRPIVITTDAQGNPIVWAFIENSTLPGYDPEASGAMWHVGSIPRDQYAECR